MILTTAEFNSKRDQVLELFSRLWYNDMLANKWRSTRTEKKKDAKLIWLFTWALDTYEHLSTAENYLIEDQVLHIFKKVNSIQ